MRLSLFFFLHIVALVILLIVNPHARAQDDGWSIIEKDKNFIYIGCQILSKKLFKNETNEKFSISKIWDKLIDSKDLHGYESKQSFYHLTNLEIFKKLKDF